MLDFSRHCHPKPHSLLKAGKLKKENLPYIRPLNAVRGLSALVVVLFHVSNLHYFPKIDLSAFSNGYLAVDMFFILSGFVLMHVYSGKFESITDRKYYSFMVSRFARIYPVHFAMLAVLLALELLKLYLHLPAFTEYKSIPSLFTSLLMIQAWHIHPINPWNGVAWSISAEWFCYFLAPLFIAFWDKFKTLTLGLFLYFIPAVFLVLYAASIHSYELTTEGGVVRIVIEFLMGLSAYGAYAELKKKNLNPRRIDTLAMGLGVLLLTSHYTHAHPIGIIYLCGAFILTCSLSTGVFSRLMSSKPLHYLGEISYSMYLVHSVLWYNLFSRLIPILPHQNFALEFGSLGALMGVTIVCAALTYHCIEKPAREWLKAALARNKKPSTAPATVLALSPAKQISA